MKDSLETKLGIFFAIAVLFFLIILESLGGFTFFKRGYHVNAYFKNVQELKTGADVKMAGVRVGRVERITLTNGVVRVDMNLNRDTDVKTDSKATVKFAGLMSQQFVSLGFGSPDSPRATDGTPLQVIEQPDFSEFMTKLDDVATGVQNLTKSFSGDKIDNLLGPLTDFVKENRTNLSATIANIKLTSDNIAQGKGTIGKLVNDDTLYQTALTTVSNLQDKIDSIQTVVDDAHTFMTNANATITQINSGKGTIGKLVMDSGLYDNGNDALKNAKEILQKVNQGQGSIGKLINDESLLKNVKLSLQKLDKATESLEDTGPLSVMGTMVSSLF